MASHRLGAAILALPRSSKRAVAIGVDILLCVFTVWLAFYLRLDQWITMSGVRWMAVLGSIALAIPIFIWSGLYRAIFRHSGSANLMAIGRAVMIYGVIYASVFTLIAVPSIPRTVGIIQPILLFFFVGLSRMAASVWLGDARRKSAKDRSKHSIVVYGAGSAGRQVALALTSSEMRVVGFLDDDRALEGRSIYGRRIHHPDSLPRLVREQGITDVLLAIPSASRRRRNEILSMIGQFAVAVRTLPGLTDLAQGRVQISDLRDLDIEDLLGRQPVEPSRALLEQKILGKVVLVTGAGGSIGSELCRQIVAAKPATLLLVDFSEAALYSIHHELSNRQGLEQDFSVRIVPLLASVCDADRMHGIISTWRPQTVYHAAAYKHVPIVEHNPVEGVWNNVFGTMATAIAARDLGVSDFVFISTDKAVRPTNVMGTSKRLAELVLQAMAESSAKTCFSMVRFGNVLGSSGSVVPLFRSQIAAGGPITITHPDINRYFMTIPEAAQLVIQAGAMARGGEVFVLDMGEPVRIVDLAEKMIALSGLSLRNQANPDGDIEIAVTGLRPGEKLYEELLIGENPELTSHPRIMKANEQLIPWPKLKRRLDRMRAEIDRNDAIGTLTLLRELVPEYVPEDSVMDWIHLERLAG